LYCGLAPAPVARRIIEALIEQNDVKAGLLAEAYLSAGLELAEDQDLRPRVMRAVAIGEGDPLETRQNRFPVEEFAPIANNAAGRRSHSISHAFRWLQQHPSLINFAHMVRRLRRPNAISPDQAAELVFLVHSFGRDEVLVEISQNSSIYLLPGPEGYETQAELALEAMALRDDHSSGPGLDAAYVRALTAIATSPKVGRIFILRGPGLIVGPSPEGWREIRPLVERIIVRLRSAKQGSGNLEQWMQELDRRDGFAPESQPQQPPNRRSRRSAKKEA